MDFQRRIMVPIHSNIECAQGQTLLFHRKPTEVSTDTCTVLYERSCLQGSLFQEALLLGEPG